jgi:hypothetical protein
MSLYPFVSALKRCLEEIVTMAGQPVDYSKPSPEQIVQLLCDEIMLPLPGGPAVRFEIGRSIVQCAMPSEREFPLLNFGFDSFFQLFSINNAIALFVSVLMEQKILFFSRSYSRLTMVADSLLALIFPFR